MKRKFLMLFIITLLTACISVPKHKIFTSEGKTHEQFVEELTLNIEEWNRIRIITHDGKRVELAVRELNNEYIASQKRKVLIKDIKTVETITNPLQPDGLFIHYPLVLTLGLLLFAHIMI